MRGTAAVSGEEGVVPFRQVGGFWEQRFEFGGDHVDHILGKRLGEGVDGLAEPSELRVELCVVGVDGVSGKEALKSKGVKF